MDFSQIYKRRKVSAVRTFPDGCGRVKSREGENGMLGANLLREHSNRIGVLESGVKPRENEHGKHGANLLKGSPNRIGVPASRVKPRENEHGTLGANPLKENPNRIEVHASGMKPRENEHGMLGASRLKGNARTDGVNVSLVKLRERGHDMFGANLSKENSRIDFPSKKYPPPRILKGFAVQRDFPLGCGHQKLPNGKSIVDMDDPWQSIVDPRKSIVDMDDFRKSININDPRKSLDFEPAKVIRSIDSNSTIKMNLGKSMVDIKSLNLGKSLVDTKLLMVGIDSNSMVGRNPERSIVDINTLEVMHGVDSNRKKVKKALHLFQEVFAKLVEDAPRATTKFHIKAAMVLRRQFKWIYTSRRLGDIPGVERGDMFQWMAELNVIGLHRQFESGIDYMKVNGKVLATSIVASGRYSNDLGSSDYLIYSGQGGNPLVRGDQPVDQELKRGNLALKNSMLAKKPIRVIRCYNISKSSTLVGVSGQKLFKKMYVYDGLYYVDRYWQERGRFGKQVFKFLLTRGQPEKLGKLKNFACQGDIERYRPYQKMRKLTLRDCVE